MPAKKLLVYSYRSQRVTDTYFFTKPLLNDLLIGNVMNITDPMHHI